MARCPAVDKRVDGQLRQILMSIIGEDEQGTIQRIQFLIEDDLEGLRTLSHDVSKQPGPSIYSHGREYAEKAERTLIALRETTAFLSIGQPEQASAVVSSILGEWETAE